MTHALIAYLGLQSALSFVVLVSSSARPRWLTTWRLLMFAAEAVLFAGLVL